MADLCTLADVKAYMGVTDTSLDALLSALISAASQFIINACGRTFAQQTYTNEPYDGTGGNTLLLNQQPITAVASVIVDGVTIPPATSQTMSGFKFDAFAVYIVGCYANGFSAGLQNVYITYTAGYVTTPADLQYAAIELVAKKYKDKQKPGTGSRHIAGESIVYTAADLTPSVRNVIGQYEKANVGLG